MSEVAEEFPLEHHLELAQEIVRAVPGVVSVTYNIAPQPPSTIEAVSLF